MRDCSALLYAMAGWYGPVSVVGAAREGMDGAGDGGSGVDDEKGWFPMLRFYGPLEPLYEKTWKLNDVELVK